jgi:hypothetical protein
MAQQDTFLYSKEDSLLDPPATHWFWGIKEKDRRCHVIGYFFDKIARYLLKEDVISFEKWLDDRNKNPDIANEKLRCHFEIKGSSNTDRFTIREDQFDSLVAELGFPIEDLSTWIFSYANREGKRGKRERLLKNHKSQEEIFEFLAKQTNVAYVVHHKLLDAMRKENGTTRNGGRSKNFISVSRTGLKLASQNTRETLTSLGLSEEISSLLPPRAKSIPFRTVETEIGGHPIKFKLFVLLPNGLKMRFLRRLNGTVVKAAN